MEPALWLGLGVAGTVLMVLAARRAWRIGVEKAGEAEDGGIDEMPEAEEPREAEATPELAAPPERTPEPTPDTPAGEAEQVADDADLAQLERDARAARARLDAARMRERRTQLEAEPDEAAYVEADTDEQEILDVSSESDEPDAREEAAQPPGRRRSGGLLGRFLRR